MAIYDNQRKSGKNFLTNKSLLRKKMQGLTVCVLTAGLVLAGVAGASAVDFTVKGEWDTYFNFGESSMFKKPYDTRHSGASIDTFEPQTRIRLEIEAAVSENLSGTLQFEMGTYQWGRAGSAEQPAGAALGERGVSVGVKRAYMDWQAPNTDLHFRVGLQGIVLPNAAGGSAVQDEDEDMTAVAVSYKVNEHVGITAVWARPYNDNYVRGDWGGGGSRQLL